MDCEFRLKTGFYETKIFDLRISRGRPARFSAESGGQVITIPKKDVISLAPKDKKFLGLEMQI